MQGVPGPETGDPVLRTGAGKVIGRHQLRHRRRRLFAGQAILPLSMSEPHGAGGISTGGGTRPIKAADRTDVGSRPPMPDAAVVLTRFPERKK